MRRLEGRSDVPVVGAWPAPLETDPITRLMSFPCFERGFDALFPERLRDGEPVGVAIGDVDEMKSYIERREQGASLTGHLAGNALMARLGDAALRWLSAWSVPWAALSSFGGDEIILVAGGTRRSEFTRGVHDLASALARDLPRSVTFACGWFEPGDRAPASRASFRPHYVAAVSLVDRALLRAKAERRRGTRARPGRVVFLRSRRYDPAGWRLCEAGAG